MSVTERLEALAYRIGCEVRERAYETHPGLTRAWVSFGCVGARVVVRTGHNVDKVIRLGAGRYRVFFTSALPHSHYCWSAQARSTAKGCLRRRFITPDATDQKTSTILDLRCTTVWGTCADAPEINLVVWG